MLETPIKEFKFTGKTKTPMIPSKLAANEVLNELKTQKKWYTISVAGFFIIALCAVISKSLSSTIAAIFTLFLAYKLFMGNKKIAYLKEKYYI